MVKVLLNDGSSKTLMVDERQNVREVLDNLFEKTHCDCNVDWSLCETNPELNLGELPRSFTYTVLWLMLHSYCGYIFVALGSCVIMSHSHINKAVCHRRMETDASFPYSFGSVWGQAEECLWPNIRPSVITIAFNVPSIRQTSLYSVQGNI